ncbi:hypothetical protein C723_2928 [Christiangramia flava JLT2011]|uniref:Uncharacterized protein n=1 Tax=Christiangramia flava JLT2011 TaxID=1229726 RepID=A0A1L7I6G7_9FLAO|nr:hypothetical protein GRFL_1978 [Christiangramia flava JLT2011]OSS38227.1 hypothetical protein C723_2928 [Christiangramia flava JLT2011]
MREVVLSGGKKQIGSDGQGKENPENQKLFHKLKNLFYKGLQK